MEFRTEKKTQQTTQNKNSTQLKHRQRKKSSSQDESHGPLRQWKDHLRDEEAEEEDEETQCTSAVEEGKHRQERDLKFVVLKEEQQNN